MLIAVIALVIGFFEELGFREIPAQESEGESRCSYEEIADSVESLEGVRCACGEAIKE